MTSSFNQPYWHNQFVLTAYDSNGKEVGHRINIQGVIPIVDGMGYDDFTDPAHRAEAVSLAATALEDFAKRQLDNPTPAWLEAVEQEGINQMSTVANKRIAALAERTAPLTTPEENPTA